MISKSRVKEQAESSYLYAGNAPFIEALYEQYLANPSSIKEPWRAYFDRLQTKGGNGGQDVDHSRIRRQFAARARSLAAPHAGHAPAATSLAAQKQAGVLRLIRAYRLLGHLRADVDPIRLRPLPPVPDLDPYFHGLSDRDRDTVFTTGTLVGPEQATLAEIEDKLKDTYLGHIGVEYIHVNEVAQRRWIEKRIESCNAKPSYDAAFKRRLLQRLTAAEGLEQYLHVKYVGQKRFSLEGSESLIPMLDTLIEQGSMHNVREIAIGMAHRGRLNVLINLMGKMPRDLFSIFEGKMHVDNVDVMGGDVKYHEGFSSDLQLPSGLVHVALAFNPSHLEIVNPVVCGSVRSRQDRHIHRGEAERQDVLAVLIHGDAAFMGQGVVYETFNLCKTRGYTIGGAIHIVVNNRIGFTLSHPADYGATPYCTDIGKVAQAPIFHVNGDDPEAVAFVAQLAVDYRATFRKDVVIDLISFRKLGHNEADEPSATQPMMYRKISEHPGTRKLYADRLVRDGVIEEKEPEAMATAYRGELEANRAVTLFPGGRNRYPYISDWSPYLNGKWTDPADTSVPIETLKLLGRMVTTVPDGFELHPRVSKIIDDRRKMSAGALPMDWGCAETLAYASLLNEGYAVRISGQDSGRGTFFHRHAVLHNQRTGDGYVPLQHIKPDQKPFAAIDSILSEEAVLAYEYGYATADPNTLVIWEAQFGDFVNGAQVVIDQFISSSEQKWRLLCGVVLMLPHGWEGQGPEHTSARLERFLQLCAQENMQVCAPTTPAQMFHLLRREMIRPYRKPLIIMSPKSMLRRKISFSLLEDLARDSFRVVIGEVEPIPPEKAQRIVLCSGKVYYDILEERQKQGLDAVAIIRIEQLYPFPKDALKQEMHKYRDAREVVWAQEEPMNQGAWYSIQHDIRECMLPHQSLSYSGRLRSPAPSGGHHQLHIERQRRLVAASLNLEWTTPSPILIFHPMEPGLERIRR